MATEPKADGYYTVAEDLSIDAKEHVSQILSVFWSRKANQILAKIRIRSDQSAIGPLVASASSANLGRKVMRV